MNNLLLFPHEHRSSQTYQVEDLERIGHVRNFLKKAVGDKIKVSVLGQGLNEAILQELGPKTMVLELLGQMRPGRDRPYHLIIGLSRPPTCQKILEHGSTLGVCAFHFFPAELSEKSYQDSKLFQNQAYLKYLYKGLAQAGTMSEVPEVTLEREFPLARISSRAQRYVLDHRSDENFIQHGPDLNSPVVLAIGPERGWTQRELERLESWQFKSTYVSSSILRVEHAVFTALGQLELFSGPASGPIER